MKLAKILIVALGLMLIAASSSFGAVIAFRTGTLNEVAINAQTALAGNIGLVPLVNGFVPAGEIVNINYDRPISSVSDMQIFVNNVDQAIVFTGFGTYPIANGLFTVDADHIALQFNTQLDVLAGVTAIEIRGVRLDVCNTGGVNSRASATISSVLGQFSTTDPDVDVAVLMEPIAISATNATVDINTAGFGGATAAVTITELFNNAFETKDGSAGDTRIAITINSPASLVLSGIEQVCTGPIPCAAWHFISTVGNVTTIGIDSNDPNLLEKIEMLLHWAPGTPPIPLNPGNATVTATLAPPRVGSGPVALGAEVVNGYLRYCNRPAVGAPVTITIGGIESLSTTLLSVFNVYAPRQDNCIATFETECFLGYNTGFAVANAGTILGPFIGQPGTITVTLWPANGGTKHSLTTVDDSLGAGLDADGMLPVDATWTVLLGDILDYLDLPPLFQGMVTFQTNFAGATGVNFIADEHFTVYAQGFPMQFVEFENFIRDFLFFGPQIIN